ncbi:hypothetical protein C4K40_2164 [Pseudomonas sp. CMR5c]|nr:hypothetical protein C4K40_2164 [Pseudomonas sp. CMR5c]
MDFCGHLSISVRNIGSVVGIHTITVVNSRLIGFGKAPLETIKNFGCSGAFIPFCSRHYKIA